ncbi:hypothetical protein PVAG01_08943 [Phlyctema vagabunda]|uniref:NAD(P)-binding domain-containing protein n=1 Tax=Phlyctema vagabunda TaxID=108571 RepID=A0ABR4PAU5_9HELO
MAPKVFLTGATGYIGGDALYILQKTHPEWSYSLLVRSKEKLDTLAKAYPDMRILLGDLDEIDLLRDEAARADIVIHAADADHEAAAKAIAEGLARHSEDNPGYWIHVSGTGILTTEDFVAERYGEASDKVFDDWENVDELTSLPDNAFHRNVDKVVLAIGERNTKTVKTAIVCPPTIYGAGRGAISRRSMQVPDLAKAMFMAGKAPVLGNGKTLWNNVHVTDLSNIFLSLAEAAAAGTEDPQIWGAKGYFLAENGEHIWGDVAELLAREAAARGYLSAAETKKMSKDEILDLVGFVSLTWGLNSRGTSKRARKVLGWNPTGKTLEEEIPALVELEWKHFKP